MYKKNCFFFFVNNLLTRESDLNVCSVYLNISTTSRPYLQGVPTWGHATEGAIQHVRMLTNTLIVGWQAIK